MILHIYKELQHKLLKTPRITNSRQTSYLLKITNKDYIQNILKNSRIKTGSAFRSHFWSNTIYISGLSYRKIVQETLLLRFITLLVEFHNSTIKMYCRNTKHLKKLHNPHNFMT